MKTCFPPKLCCLTDILRSMGIGPMIRPLAWTILLSVALAVHAQTVEPDIGARLQSSCIWSPSSPPGRQVYVAFRKDFDLPALPDTALLHIFADSRYMLWINDAYVLRGPCRFDPQRPEYDSMDVHSFLRPGANRMMILVHHYAGGNNSKIVAHDPGLMAELVLPGAVIRTDSNWRSCAHTAYLPSPAAWGSIPDVMDGRIVSGEADWEATIGVDGKKWGAMQPRAIPLPRETVLTGLNALPSRQALVSVLPLELTAGKELLVDVGRMAMAFTTVDLEADAGSILQLQYALRYINGKAEEPYGVGTTYTARAGRQNFITGDEWGCHYATLRCVAGRIKLLGVTMTDRRYPFERLGRFSCNDSFLNRLWDMAVNTIESTSDDGYGADARERNEWLQDPAQPNYITTRVALAGPAKDGKSYEQEAQALAAAINRHLWNEQAKTYQSGFVKDSVLGPTAHAALLALDRGVVPPERIASVRQWFLTNYRRPAGFHCGQNDDYEKMVAAIADPAVFTKLATVALPCDGGVSEVRLSAKDGDVLGHHVAAVRFAFQDGPLGFNVYREINLVGQPTSP